MRKAFHFQTAIAQAWKLCWQDNLERRAKGIDFRGHTYYLTASDIETQVRQFAYETATGVEWGSTGRVYYHLGTPVRISVPGGLQSAVRHWLMSQRDIVYHNFSRGHISGARFRPRGEPLSENEQRTLEKRVKESKVIAEKKARGEPLHRVHYRKEGEYENICVLEQRRKKREAAKAKGLYYHGPYRQSRRRWGSCTRNPADVTCPICRNLLGVKKEAA